MDASARPWLAHYPPGVPSRLEYPRAPVPAFLRDAARSAPAKTATIFFGARRTYAETWEEAVRFARALARSGIRPGDRVALILPNCPQAVSAHYGTLLAGAVVVWVNPLYTPRELAHQLADSGARAAVCLDLVQPRLASVRSELPLSLVVCASLRERLPFPLRQLYPLRQKSPRIAFGGDTVRYDDFLRRGAGGPRGDDDLPGLGAAPDDLALLQYTGGTTGTAKGAMLTHGNLVANVVQTQAWMGERPPGRDVVLAALPFFHVYGLTTVLHYGVSRQATLVLLARPTPEDAVRAIERHRVTIFPGTPTMYVGVNRLPGIARRDLKSVEACISGSAPLPLEVQREFERLTGGRLVEGYGLTEASPVTHANPIWGERREGTVGLPWPDTDAVVVDPATIPEPGAPPEGELGLPEGVRVLGPGEVGELWVRGPQVMRGYWNRPEETAAVLVHGWLRTGDLAAYDEDGYFRIVDRLKDVIIAGGYNIYPREVEEVLYALPEVEEAAVVGVPDPYRGETVKAVIKRKAGARLDEAQVLAHCRRELAAYKVPRIVEFRDELPKSAVGKILRRELAGTGGDG
ncbi:MAG: long-chain fatty acid--CoA ligase [Clostridia bacterium]|nr:long-chain fatty acid--CoA ligase [Clostridia bacterium]